MGCADIGHVVLIQWRFHWDSPAIFITPKPRSKTLNLQVLASNLNPHYVRSRIGNPQIRRAHKPKSPLKTFWGLGLRVLQVRSEFRVLHSGSLGTVGGWEVPWAGPYQPLIELSFWNLLMIHVGSFELGCSKSCARFCFNLALSNVHLPELEGSGFRVLSTYCASISGILSPLQQQLAKGIC